MRRNPLMLGIAAILFTMVWFALLGGRPLFDPDEGRYADIPREMLSGGDWVIPHLNGLVYLEKPPLQYWLTALSLRVFGSGEFAARLCTGVAGFLSLVVLLLLGRHLGGFEAGVRSVMLAGASALFVLLGHQLTLDMLLSFCLFASLGAFIMAQTSRDNPRRCAAWMLGCWAAMALAVLTKGLVGVLIPAATLCLYLIWQRDWPMLRRLNLRWGAALFTAIAAPWFILAARANPAFLRFFFIREHFQRFLTPIEHRTQPWWFFLPVLLAGIAVWTPQALNALAASRIQRVPRGQFDVRRLLTVWCAFIFVFFSLSDSKLIPYILPLVPALALLCAQTESVFERRSLSGGAIISAAAAAGILVYVSVPWRSPATQALVQSINPLLWSTVAVLAVGCGFSVWQLRRGQTFAALAGLCAAWFLASATVLVAANKAQDRFSGKDIAMTLLRTASADAPIFAVQSFSHALPYYLRRPVILVDYRDEFDLGLHQEPERGIATLEDFRSTWAALPEGYAVMSQATLNRLSALDVPMHELAHFPDRVLVGRR